MAAAPAIVSIDPRFRGPPRSANGGYACGLLAHALGDTATVRLHRPPPLSRPLRIEPGAGVARLLDDDGLVAEARADAPPLEVPVCPDPDTVTEAARHFVGFTTHAFPECFVCGPKRRPGDGLCIHAGPVPGRELVAAPWVPDETLADADGPIRPEFLWAALDCPGAFAVLPLTENHAVVLGELAATLRGTLRPGDPCTVIGWPIATEGRKRFAGTAVFGPDARPVAMARATWIEVPLQDWA